MEGKMTPTWVESSLIPVFTIVDCSGPRQNWLGFSVIFRFSSDENSIVTFWLQISTCNGSFRRFIISTSNWMSYLWIVTKASA